MPRTADFILVSITLLVLLVCCPQDEPGRQEAGWAGGHGMTCCRADMLTWYTLVVNLPPFSVPFRQNFIFCHPQMITKSIPARRSVLAGTSAWPSSAPCAQTAPSGGGPKTSSSKRVSPMLLLLDAAAQRSLAPHASSYDDKINSTLSTAEVCVCAGYLPMLSILSI